MNHDATTTAGLDLGDSYSQVCLVDDTGEVIEQGRVRTTEAGLRHYFGKCSAMRVVLEVGTHSPWSSRLLEELGHQVLVANARKVRLIYGNDRKNDRLDAEALARLGRLDPTLLSAIRHRGVGTQADLEVIRARAVLVRSRTQLICHVRGAVKSMGQRLPGCSSDSFGKQIAEVPENLRDALQPLFACIEQFTAQIHHCDRQVEELARTRYPETEPLRTIPGVGPLTAVAYVTTLEDPQRFACSRQVGAYLGLAAGQKQSGGRDPQRRITKAGDPYLRQLLVGSAHYIMGPFGPDSALRRWGLSLSTRGGKNAKKRAAVAVARKLAVLMHRLWISSQVYTPFPGGGGDVPSPLTATTG